MGIAKSSLMVQTHVELDMSMLSEGTGRYSAGGTGLAQTIQGTQFAQTIEEENLEAA